MQDPSNTKQTRRPRFRRSDKPPSFQLTERDVEILRQIARHRFLRSTHISQLLSAPHKKICERLTLLYHTGHLDRPRSQLEYYVRSGGSEPYVYALGNQGARLLKDCDGLDQTSIDWARKNKDSARNFLLHTLSVSEFRVALAVACRARAGLRLVEPDELLQAAPEQTRQSPNPWSWRVRVQFKGQTTEVGIIPDYVFALILPDGRRRPFVVECDRGTMPIERHSLAQTSMVRKFLAYEASYKQGLHTARYGWKNFRVLVSTTSQGRVLNMLATAGDLLNLNAPMLFLLADQSTLIQSDILSSCWRNCARSESALI